MVSPIDIVFTEHNVLQPDICFFQALARHFVKPRTRSHARLLTSSSK